MEHKHNTEQVQHTVMCKTQAVSMIITHNSITCPRGSVMMGIWPGKVLGDFAGCGKAKISYGTTSKQISENRHNLATTGEFNQRAQSKCN